MHRTIVLVVMCVTLGAGEVSAQDFSGVSILLVGDSIGVSWGASDNSNALQSRLERANRHWYVFNISRAGMGVTPSKWPAFNPSLIGLNGVFGNYVVVMLGTNDFGIGAPLDEFATGYQRILDAARWWSVAPVCVTPLWRADEQIPNAQGATLEDYRAAIRLLCAGFPIVEGPSLIPSGDGFFCDGLHPNDRGYRALGKNLSRALREVVD